MNLKHLTDKTLLNDARKLSLEERRLSSQLLYHIREIEKRKLFSDLGYSSLHQYLVMELKYSDGAASRRVKASRLLEQLPKLKEKIIDGSLSLSNISLAAGFFKNEKIESPKEKADILSQIENKTSRDV